jgi:hypothetical protein
MTHASIRSRLLHVRGDVGTDPKVPTRSTDDTRGAAL